MDMIGRQFTCGKKVAALLSAPLEEDILAHLKPGEKDEQGHQQEAEPELR